MKSDNDIWKKSLDKPDNSKLFETKGGNVAPVKKSQFKTEFEKKVEKRLDMLEKALKVIEEKLDAFEKKNKQGYNKLKKTTDRVNYESNI